MMILLWLVIVVLGALGVGLHKRVRVLEAQFAGFATWAGPIEEPQIEAFQEAGASSQPAHVAEPQGFVSASAEDAPAVESQPLGDGPAPTLSTADDQQDWPSETDGDADQQPERAAFSFEDLFGRRLPIWAGGITLAIAGVLIVKLSIDAGLISPAVRVIAGTLFGLLLIAGGELTHRFEQWVRDQRVPQALAGAGIASLYASTLIAANLYQLIPAVPAMLAMAAVTALALGLAARFGAPCALLGLVGGLSAPALIGSAEPNVPLLTLYLGLAVAGLCTLSRSQRWAWLAVSALIGGFGWGALLLLGGVLDAPGTIALGLYVLLLGTALPALGFAGDWKDRLRLATSVVAAGQMALLVATGGFAMLNWALFAMISAATVWLSRTQPALRPLPAIGLVIAILLASAWPDPGLGDFAMVVAGIALIFGLPAQRQLWTARGNILEAAQVAATALAAFLLPLFHFHSSDGSADAELGLLALAMATVAAASAASGWTNPQRRKDSRFAILSSAAALLLAAASSLLLESWIVGVVIAAVGLIHLTIGRMAADRRMEPVSWALAAAGLTTFLISALTPESTAIESGRWLMAALLAALFAWRGRARIGRTTAQFVAPLLAYGALVPIVGDPFEPLLAPLGLVALAWASARPARKPLVPAMASTALIMLAWAIEPLGQWLAAAATSLVAIPVMVQHVPAPGDAISQLLATGLSLAAAVFLCRQWGSQPQRRAAFAIAALLALVALHSLFKQLFTIASPEEFVAYGLAERLVWELALVAAAAALWRKGWKIAALAAAAAAAGHSLLYTLVLHNPLWAEQAVGALPVLNLLVPAYALPLLLLWGLHRHEELSELLPDRLIGGAQMTLILLLAASLLRQLFHGSILVAPGLSPAEDIARSLVAILLAIGFLLWGIASGRREWRLGSLVLMLGAVCKVFLWDASGLEGVVRIASFVALGFSLIGIGWLYARHVQGDAAPRRARPALA